MRSSTWMLLGLVVVLLAAAVVGRMRWPRRIDGLPPRHVEYRVDVNTADVPALGLLPAIGPSMAERIVAERREHGPFKGPEDLLRVRGMGEVTLARIRPFISCGVPATQAQ